MANFFITLIPLLSLLIPTALSDTYFYYDFYGSQPKDLTYQGDAHFPPPSESTYLRLTKTDASGLPVQYSAGRVVYTSPVQFWETGKQVDLETTIKFIITPVDDKPADGIVFFIAPVGTTIPDGSAGASFGVFESNLERNPGIFAVEFDAYVNSDLGDPSYRHAGIDIEYLKSVNTTTDVGSAIIGQEVTALIEYEEATKVIRVKVTAGSKSFEVRYVKDLKTILDQQVQVGLAAASGAQVAIHDIISWYFTATLVNTATEDDAKIRLQSV